MPAWYIGERDEEKAAFPILQAWRIQGEMPSVRKGEDMRAHIGEGRVFQSVVFSLL